MFARAVDSASVPLAQCTAHVRPAWTSESESGRSAPAGLGRGAQIARCRSVPLSESSGCLYHLTFVMVRPARGRALVPTINPGH